MYAGGNADPRKSLRIAASIASRSGGLGSGLICASIRGEA